ncbi:MAG: T9SS type A sorting domain-containing protein, partial [Chitinophagaceae bacterium]
LGGNYNDREESYLYSPCFNLSGLSNPTLSFSLALDLEDCGSTVCDAAWVEYSLDGATWTKLGTALTGTNWYNKTSSNVWSRQNYTIWRVASASLPVGASALRLRFAMSSDESTSREGIAIDDIHIFDNLGVYTGPTPAAPATQPVSGSSWIDFTQGGKLIASINPQGQILGSTDVQVYIDTTTSHYTSNQYYLGRSLTIKPATRGPFDPVTVRLYFTERESELLINATGCAGCAKPATAFDLGVSKYTDADLSHEDGSLANNTGGSWSFYGASARTIVPYDGGYYAEFTVNNFSEFWFNSGGIQGAPLPVRFLSFTARRNGAAARLDWDVALEENVARYEVEVAEGEDALRRGQYRLLGNVDPLGTAAGSRRYSYLDARPGKSGTYYYRLRVRNADGSWQFSAIRPVLFSEQYEWNVYPNPSAGAIHLNFHAADGSTLRLRLYDGQGRLLRDWSRVASGFVEKETIDLAGFAAGVYLLQADGPEGVRSFRLYKR